ncbi:MAG: hypothetical protein K0B52_02305 [FCB group bacterium]|nr:hypothetical protein [FCB group bacterium]
MNATLIQILFLAVLIYIAPTLVIHEYLRKYNEKIPNILLFNFRIGDYLKQYRKVSKIKTGKIGFLYYLWFITLGISLAMIVLAFFIKDITY